MKNQSSLYNDRKNQEYQLEAKYHTTSLWDYSIRTPSAYPGVLMQETKEKQDTWKKSPLSINLVTSEGGLRQDPVKSLEATVMEMLNGLPEEIDILQTLFQLFSFKIHGEMPVPYNIGKAQILLVPRIK